MRAEVKRFDHRPFVAPLLGRDVMVVVSTPQHCLEVNRRANELPRGWAYKPFPGLLGLSHEMLFTNWGESWKAQRTTANPFFRPSTLRSLIGSVHEYSRVVEERMLAHKGQFGERGVCVCFGVGADFPTQEMKLESASVTMMVICDYVFGHALSADTINTLVDFFSFGLAAEGKLHLTGLRWLPLPHRLGFFRKRRAVLQLLEREIDRAEKGSFCERTAEQTMAQKVSALAQFGAALTLLQLADIIGVVFAGFETTSTTICWALYGILEQEPLRLRVLSELRTQLAGRTIDELTAADLNECHLLSACIDESLRLHPAATGRVGDVASLDGLTVCGVHLPHGTPVYACVAGRDGRSAALLTLHWAAIRPACTAANATLTMQTRTIQTAGWTAAWQPPRRARASHSTSSSLHFSLAITCAWAASWPRWRRAPSLPDGCGGSTLRMPARPRRAHSSLSPIPSMHFPSPFVRAPTST